VSQVEAAVWRRFQVVVGVLAFVACFVALGSSAAVAKKIEITAKTTIEISAERTADGGINPKVVFSSTNPRCLSAERFPRWRDGHFNTAGSVLYYGGGREFNGNPPEAWLSPTSRPDPRTYVWEGNWAGSTPTRYHPGSNISVQYDATVATATGGFISAWAGSKRFNVSPFKVKYWRGDTKIKLTCPPATETLYF
jgi:hypothetical protein